MLQTEVMFVRTLLAAGLIFLLPLAAACSDNKPSSTTPTVPASASVTTTAASTPSTAPSATATKSTATTAASATPAADGTIDPLNPGQQTPWRVKSNPEPSAGIATVAALRMGLHPEEGGWERIVFEFTGSQLPEATVQYVDSATACASGMAIAPAGNTILEVAILDAQAHTAQGTATIPSQVTPPGGPVIASAQSSCDFEGHVTWVFGLNGKHNFKVTTFTNPTRLVIDIKQ